VGLVSIQLARGRVVLIAYIQASVIAKIGRYSSMIEIPELNQETINRFWDKVDKSGDCWEWTASTNQDGYGRICILVNGKKRWFQAHRISYYLNKGSIRDGKIICHNCDNPACVNPDHLYSGTWADNTHDAVNRGMMNMGEKNGNSRFVKSQIIEIRNKYATGKYSYRQIANEYDTYPMTICGIVRRKSWRHVE